mmetsp:Transcript_24946/g.70238  ORF Transcript_24946/g.70238 Transcript_24946/m.70238 type:complete len:226 (+) Transcript_24946:240-917(+)
MKRSPRRSPPAARMLSPRSSCFHGRRSASLRSPAVLSAAPGRPKSGVLSTSWSRRTPLDCHSSSAATMSFAEEWCGSPRLRMEYAPTLSQSMYSCTKRPLANSARPGRVATLSVLPPAAWSVPTRSRQSRPKWSCSMASNGAASGFPPAGSSECHSISRPSAPQSRTRTVMLVAKSSLSWFTSASSSSATSSGCPRRLMTSFTGMRASSSMSSSADLSDCCTRGR